MTDLDKQSATPLRAACIHGRYELHRHHLLKTLPEVCPGGQEVTDDEIRRLAYELVDWDAAEESMAGAPGWGSVVDAALRQRDTDHIFHAKNYDGSGIWCNAAGDEAVLGDGNG